jgi:ketosteroid isomerase-like protein
MKHIILSLVSIWAALNVARAQSNEATSLYETVVALDKAYFTAYNTCDMETQQSLLAEDIEFYHDQGGLSTSKTDILKGIAENICGKVTRTVVEGSLEVSPIPGYGAVLVGLHQFKNNREPEGTPSKKSRFVGIWKKTENQWQMTRIISLH